MKDRPGTALASPAIDARAWCGSAGAFAFGTQAGPAAAALRALADMIESEEVLLQAVKIFSVAKDDDFTMTTIALDYALPRPPNA